jgi:hypothetical protein
LIKPHNNAYVHKLIEKYRAVFTYPDPLNRPARAVKRSDELSSEPPAQILVTFSPPAKAEIMNPWTAKNRRRISLIQKKHGQGLNPEETIELSLLKVEMAAHIKRIAPRSTEALEEFEQFVKGLKAQAKTRKPKLP